MQKISTADLKKAILAADAERAKQPSVPRPTRAQQQTLQKNRRASEQMVAEFLTGAGLDLEKFRALQERRTAELERIVDKHKTDALRRASRQENGLQANIAEQAEALRDLASQPDFFPYPSFSLDTPFLIWTAPLLALADSAAVPFGSWAKFRVATSDGQGGQKVSFYFDWASPFRDYAVINAVTFMSATGHLRAHAPWGLGANASEVDAWALFGLSLGFRGELSSVPYSAEFLGEAHAYGSLVTGGEANGSSVSAGVNLSQTMFA